MSPAFPNVPYSPRPVVAGPMATGKSALALDLAGRMHSDEPATHTEIINTDASLLYRDMDIDTAKLSPAERARVPHHQTDVPTVRDRASVAVPQRSTHGDIDAVESRGHLPTITGGSNLYVRALIDDLGSPGAGPAIRSHPSEHVEREGAAISHAELARPDPVAAERVEASNTRRIVRAPEVIEITGRLLSASLPRYENVAPTAHITLRCKRRPLDERISERAHAMLDDGLAEEVEALVDQDILEGETAPRAIGHAQTLAVTDGTTSVPEAADSTALATRQFAPRRIKWFRHDPRLCWADVALTEAGQHTDSERSRFTRQVWEFVHARRGIT